MGICFSNVVFSYPGRTDKVILNIPEWNIQSAEHVLIQGPSGSGKTTFLNIIAGLLSPVKGSVKILNKRIEKMSSKNCDSFRANNIGYVFQNFNLIPYLNVVDNIRLATSFSKSSVISDVESEIYKLLKNLNIAEQDWTLKSRHLSFGQRQRVAIARAMINRPEILIADEPTSALDAPNKKIFLNQLLKLVNRHKTTLVLVSHDDSLKSYFYRIDKFSDFNVTGKN